MKLFIMNRRIPERDVSSAMEAAIANLTYAKRRISSTKLEAIKGICDNLIATITLTKKVVDREAFLIEDAQAQYASDAIPAQEEDDGE